VRTLAEGEGRYNPIGYHLGTVWPFDSSIVAWGLRRYGFKEEAAQIAAGILDAAEFFEGRLPEAFGGYERSVTHYPVQYPTACSPQAWSPARRCSCSGRCSASNRSTSTSWSTPPYRSGSGDSSFSTSQGAGGGSTPSAAVA
jgi:glycogen debranching enzyme